MRERCFNYDLAFDHILPTGCQYHCFQTLREECSCAVARMAAATVTIVIFVTFAPHRLWKIAAWLMRTFSWKSRAYANRMPYVVFSKSSRFGEDKIHLADVFHSATHQETFNDLLVHQHGNGFFTTSRCTSSIPDMQWKSFPLPLPTVSLTRVYPPTLTIPYYFFWGEGLGTSHQLHSILQVGATKQIPHTKKQQTRVIYVYIIFSEWPWFCWVFFFLHPLPVGPKRRSPLEANAPSNAMPAVRSEHKAGIGEDFSNLRGVAIGKKRWGMGNSRIHVHIMCICIYLWDTIISLLPFLWLSHYHLNYASFHHHYHSYCCCFCYYHHCHYD